MKTVGVLIKERNTILTEMNVDARFDLDNLPDFFKLLRHVFEDDAFTKMILQLQDVRYVITPIYAEQDITAQGFTICENCGHAWNAHGHWIKDKQMICEEVSA